MMETKFVMNFSLSVLLLSASVIAQNGGGFEITEAVVAGGGASSSAGIFDLEYTVGQSGAGGPIGSGPFSITSGYWNFTSLAPTAAPVSISGRILTPNGSGLTNALLYLQTQDGEFMTARSSSFGFYRFEGIGAGQTVLIWVESKRFSYAPRTVNTADDITGLDFIPEP